MFDMKISKRLFSLIMTVILCLTFLGTMTFLTSADGELGAVTTIQAEERFKSETASKVSIQGSYLQVNTGLVMTSQDAYFWSLPYDVPMGQYKVIVYIKIDGILPALGSTQITRFLAWNGRLEGSDPDYRTFISTNSGKSSEFITANMFKANGTFERIELLLDVSVPNSSNPSDTVANGVRFELQGSAGVNFQVDRMDIIRVDAENSRYISNSIASPDSRNDSFLTSAQGNLRAIYDSEPVSGCPYNVAGEGLHYTPADYSKGKKINGRAGLPALGYLKPVGSFTQGEYTLVVRMKLIEATAMKNTDVMKLKLEASRLNQTGTAWDLIGQSQTVTIKETMFDTLGEFVDIKCTINLTGEFYTVTNAGPGLDAYMCLWLYAPGTMGKDGSGYNKNMEKEFLLDSVTIQDTALTDTLIKTVSFTAPTEDFIRDSLIKDSSGSNVGDKGINGITCVPGMGDGCASWGGSNFTLTNGYYKVAVYMKIFNKSGDNDITIARFDMAGKQYGDTVEKSYFSNDIKEGSFLELDTNYRFVFDIYVPEGGMTACQPRLYFMDRGVAVKYQRLIVSQALLWEFIPDAEQDAPELQTRPQGIEATENAYSVPLTADNLDMTTADSGEINNGTLEFRAQKHTPGGVNKLNEDIYLTNGKKKALIYYRTPDNATNGEYGAAFFMIIRGSLAVGAVKVTGTELARKTNQIVVAEIEFETVDDRVPVNLKIKWNGQYSIIVDKIVFKSMDDNMSDQKNVMLSAAGDESHSVMSVKPENLIGVSPIDSFVFEHGNIKVSMSAPEIFEWLNSYDEVCVAVSNPDTEKSALLRKSAESYDYKIKEQKSYSISFSLIKNGEITQVSQLQNPYTITITCDKGQYSDSHWPYVSGLVGYTLDELHGISSANATVNAGGSNAQMTYSLKTIGTFYAGLCDLYELMSPDGKDYPAYKEVTLIPDPSTDNGSSDSGQSEKKQDNGSKDDTAPYVPAPEDVNTEGIGFDELTEESLRAAIEAAAGDIVKYSTKSPGIVTARMFQMLRDASKILQYEILDEDGEPLFIWEFREISDVNLDVDTRIFLFSEHSDAILSETGKNKTIVLDFAYSGNLPGKTNIFVRNIGKVFSMGDAFVQGDKANLYLFDKVQNKLAATGVKAGFTADRDWTAFTIEHCSVYTVTTYTFASDGLTPDETDDAAAGLGFWWIAIIAAVVILLAGAVVIVLVAIRKKSAKT